MSNFLYKNIFLYIDILFKAAKQGYATHLGWGIDNYLLLSKEPVQGKSLFFGGRLGRSKPEGGNKNNDNNNKNRKIFDFLKKLNLLSLNIMRKYY